MASAVASCHEPPCAAFRAYRAGEHVEGRRPSKQEVKPSRELGVGLAYPALPRPQRTGGRRAESEEGRVGRAGRAAA